MRKILIPLMGLSFIPFTLSSCNQNKNNTLSVTYNISENEKFESCICDTTEDSFKSLGFTLGDSLNISFSNGYTINDIPYFSGYYVKTGYPLVVSYPGFNSVSITYNNEGIWSKANLDNTLTVTITLNEVGKYKDTEEALSQKYSDNLADYTAEAEFANFRVINNGNLKTNLLYRGASPCDNVHNRASVVDNLLKENNIDFIIDLADSKDNMESYINNTTYDFPYTKSLYKDNKIALLEMGSSFSSDSYKAALYKGLYDMLESNPSRVYIHCMEGKDRTGFVCLLLEALVGASYTELRDDYMMTYYNYYKISESNNKSKYDAIVSLYFDAFLEYLHGTSDQEILKNASFVEDAKEYIRSMGASECFIEKLINFLTK